MNNNVFLPLLVKAVCLIMLSRIMSSQRPWLVWGPPLLTKVGLQLIIVVFSAILHWGVYQLRKRCNFLKLKRQYFNESTEQITLVIITVIIRWFVLQQELVSVNHLIFDGLEALLKPAAPPRFSVIKRNR